MKSDTPRAGPQRRQGHASKRTATGPKRPAAPALAAFLAALAFGCGSPPTIDVQVAELVPFATSGVDTDVIFPREEGASRFLIRNWPPMSTHVGNTVWVHGKWARIGFFSVADAPPRLVFEARPYVHPDAPTQVLDILLNGQPVASLPMPQSWEGYDIELPGELVEVGWNELELSFAHTVRPSDLDPDNPDGRTLTAQFRRIEMRGAAGRPHWPERPGVVALVSGRAANPDASASAVADAATGPVDTASDPATGVIEMPTDSFLDAYLVPAAGARVIGAVEAGFEAGAAGAVHAVLDAVRPDGAQQIWSAELRPAAARATVAAELGARNGEVVGLRLRVFGSANALVRWTGLATTAPEGPGESPQTPEQMVVPPRSGALGRPDVFLIILDAARADRFDGELGAELAPNVHALAGNGTAFAQAWSPSSWTGQTIPSLFSGLTPDSVGIEHWGSLLPATVSTFPELLHAAGYHTTLWSQHNIYRARAPLRHGFETFAEVDSADITQRIVLPAVTDLVDDTRPTLAIIHLLPPHEPYEPPAPFAGTRSGWYEGERIDAQLLNQFDARFPEEQTELRAEIRRAALAQYEENVQFADHLVGRLVDDLRAQGRYDDALIIVTADHGEAFYEHGRFLHTSLLYEEFIHVPLVIKWPRSFSGWVARVNAPVSLVDIAPTLIDGLAVVDERALYQGRSLLPLARGEAQPSRILYAYTSGETNPDRDPKPKHALRWKDMKLIQDDRYDRSELFHLSDDPGETRDLSPQADFYARWLLQTMRVAQTHHAGFLMRAGGAQAEELDEETIRGLRALGYLR
jgi:arylsulfatase A-like enzyme